jgi:hypothetical protein
MNVRWTAVMTGFLVDFLIGIVLSLFISPDIYTAPDITQPSVLFLLGLPVVLTTVSGYVAGRVAKTSRVLNGLLVQVVSILFSQLIGPIPRVLVVTYAIACIFAALGGYLSRFPAERQPDPASRR